MSFDSYVGVCQDCGHKFHAIGEGNLLCPVCAVKKEGSGATIKKVAAHPDGPVEGVEIIMDEIEPKPFFKKRIHIRVEGTDREFIYDVNPDYTESANLTDALVKAEREMKVRGLHGTMKAMDEIEPDGTVVPDFDIMDGAHEVLSKPHVIRCEAAERLSEIRATILVNFGLEGKKHNGITVKKDKSVLKMMISVFQMYSDLVEHLEAGIQTCKEGHKYLADSHEYPCPRCNIASQEHIIESFHKRQPYYDNQPVTQGALNALVGQRDVAWRVRYKDRVSVLSALHRLHIDTESDTIPGSVLRAWIKEEEEKIPPESECKTIIHAMAEKPDEFARLVAQVLLWHGHMERKLSVVNESIKKLGAWMCENGYEFEEFT